MAFKKKCFGYVYSLILLSLTQSVDASIQRCMSNIKEYNQNLFKNATRVLPILSPSNHMDVSDGPINMIPCFDKVAGNFGYSEA